MSKLTKSLVTETPAELLYMAENDIISFRELLSGTYYPADRKYNVICFLATQAVEKILKGFIKNNDKEVEKEHNLEYLHNIATGIDASFTKIKNDCVFLNNFLPNIKYNPKISITKQDMEKITKSLETICNFPPIKTIRDSFSKKHNYEIIASVAADPAKPSDSKTVKEIPVNSIRPKNGK